MKRIFLLLPIAFLVMGFGENKVQYREFDWRVMPTPHFKIFFYTGGEEIVKFGAEVLEDSYKRLSNALASTPQEKIPVIIYNNHGDFEQTNVTLELIEESVGGFTEIYKNRVVVPFNGSYKDFRHVLNHELTHVFQFDIVRGNNISSMLSSTAVYQVPLWFIEGMAEYFSLHWDAESDMVIRDAIYYDRIVPIQKLWQIEGSYLMYKEGQSILNFIAERYGEKKIGEIFRKIGFIGGFDKAIKSSIGIDIEELNTRWMKEIKSEAWVRAGDMDELPKNSRRLTKHKNYVFNAGPSISPDGTEIVFFSDRDQYEGMWLASALSGKIKRRLVRGGKSKGFESLHIMESTAAWSKEGNRIAFVSKEGGRDVLYIMDIKSNKIIHKFKPSPPTLSSPSWSPVADEIVFRGVRDSKADLYRLDIKSGKVSMLTDDCFDDRTPSFSEDGKNIYFASDRPGKSKKLKVKSEKSTWHYGLYGIYRIGRDGLGLKLIMNERAKGVSFPVERDDKIIFISDRAGSRNLYSFDTATGKFLQNTNVMGSISSFSIAGDKIALGVYTDGGWDVFCMKYNKGIEPKKPMVFETPYVDITQKFDTLSSQKSGLEFTPDFAQGSLAYSNVWGLMTNAQIAVSDILGNHRIYLITDTPGNLLESNFNLSYWYLPKRINFGIGIFQEKYSRWLFEDLFEKERLLGGAIAFQYPFDKFRRIEGGIDEYSIQDILYYCPNNDCFIWDKANWYVLALSLSYVTDNTIWGYMGPINGERKKIGVERSLPLTDDFLSYDYLSMDFRKYIRIVPRYTFAMRFWNENLFTKDNIQSPSIGGPETLRGYDYDSFYGNNIGGVNLELRYPFIDRLKIAFPIPISIYGIGGVLFTDLGYAKDNLSTFRLWKDSRLENLYMGFGGGARIRISYFILKFDLAKHTDLLNVSDTYFHFSMGSEF
jgi:Tol biopolymer transport system component